MLNAYIQHFLLIHLLISEIALFYSVVANAYLLDK